MLNRLTSAGACVRRLTIDDSELYAEFRLRMWPIHSGAGGWESVRLKYFHNPHADLCPESGIYAFVQNDAILGIMGAYPMPVTLDGSEHRGHMIVDWAVLPEHQFGLVTGVLWNTLMTLEGRKYSSIGARASQSILAKRAVQIPITHTIAYLRPVEARVLRGLRLEQYSYPSPLAISDLRLPPSVQPLLAEDFQAPAPHIPNTAYVSRGRDFWNVYCSGRVFNAAIPLQMVTPSGAANVIVRLLECGRFRYASLMALDLRPAVVDNARATGALLRKTLDSLGVMMLNAVEADSLTRETLQSMSRFVSRGASYWWGIRKSSDTFDIEAVNWWLTNADRDSHWAGNQPIAATG